MRGRFAGLLLLVGALMLGGCATTNRADPLEPLNRKVFAFNETLDVHLIKPAATAYSNFVPRPVRVGVDNFFSNVKDLWSAVNLFLQGRFEDGLHDVMRFGTNTVLGCAGIADVATEVGFERHSEDFGQTLGKWGVPPGAYIVWPILGPSTVRDSVGLPVDHRASPEQLMKPVSTRNTLTALRVVNARSNLLGATQVLDDIALDKYTFIRDAYLQRRRSLIYDGEPPDDDAPKRDGEQPDESKSVPKARQPAADAPAPAASAPDTRTPEEEPKK